MIFGTILWLLSACGRHARIMLPLGVVDRIVDAKQWRIF